MSRSFRLRFFSLLLFLIPVALLAADAILKPSKKTDVAKKSSAVKSKIDFAKQIEPLLRSHCYSCHGDEEEGGLRLDTKEHFLAGGDSGLAFVAGKSEKSPLYLRSAHLGDDDPMPPKGEGKPLSKSEVALIKRWIDQGAILPKALKGGMGKTDHWAFQPINSNVKFPAVKNKKWVRNGIDAFVLNKLEQEGIKASPEADRNTLIRRAYIDLIGLPPTPQEWQRWKTNSEANWYEQMVDHLLASPHYGERWGRRWLDVARYADSDGYEKDKPRPHAWRWREWVIRAFNADMPFDQFTKEQMAGDLFPNATLEQKVATGFHRNTLVNREGGIDPEEDRVKRTIDRTNTMGGAWLGLTVGCCQCHSHKYDPLSQKEYYQMYSFFNNMEEPNIGAPFPVNIASYKKKKAAFDKTYKAKYLDAITQYKKTKLKVSLDKWEATKPDTKSIWTVIKPETFRANKGAKLTVLEDNSLLASKNNPGRQQEYHITFRSKTTGITGFRVEALPDASLPKNGPGRATNGNFVLSQFIVKTAPIDLSKPIRQIKLAKAKANHTQQGTNPVKVLDGFIYLGWGIAPRTGKRHVLTVETKTPVGNKAGLQYAIQLTSGTHLAQYQTLGRFRISYTTAKAPLPFDGMDKNLADIITIPKGKRTVKQQTTLLNHFATIDPGYIKLKKAADVYLKKAPKNPWHIYKAQTIAEKKELRKTHVLIRGNFLTPGKEVQRGSFGVLNTLKPRGKQLDRIDLANWLTSSENPLTTRVTVNRMWQHHFGRGIVSSVNDFGTQGEKPSHPELLDWLATQFRTEMNWSLKKLHKLIVTSATYRQSAVARPELLERDPYNSWLARQNRLRVEAEIVRDVALSASGLLVPTIGGPSVRPPRPPGLDKLGYANGVKWKTSKGDAIYRRGLYTFFQRTVPYPMLMTFDAPDSNTSCVRRNSSNTPLQSLTLWNDSVFIECAQVLGQRIVKEVSVTKNQQQAIRSRIQYGFQLCFSRQPTEKEISILIKLYQSQLAICEKNNKITKEIIGKKKIPKNVKPAELAAWVIIGRTLINLDEFITRG
ncbi:hypothetical protein MNBD_PLANCTO02-262 [hydrothermal vent metagenome]|uniref:Cytochrome c domain-containing protein n=1 Tax=hydrothermal vent metagenome TaxID=652676 RepID=A0A3B1DBR3_9ZZZZ